MLFFYQLLTRFISIKMAPLLKWGSCIFFLLLGAFDVYAQTVCGTPQILFPAQLKIEHAKPRFEWAPVENAKSYRLWLESRVPEGRVLSTHDIQTTATNWTPPSALTETRAFLKVKLIAICNEMSVDPIDVPAQPNFVRYTIDVSESCVITDSPVVKISNPYTEVSWPRVEGVEHYELMLFSGTDAKLFKKTETRNPHFQYEFLTPGVWTVSVRARCPSGYGAFRTKVMNLKPH